MLLGFALMAMIDEGKLLRDDEAAFSQMFGGGVLIFAGLAGIVLGLVTILAGFGLKRMKQWGLWSTYVVMALWLLVDALVLMFSGFSLAYLTIKLCVLIGLMLSIIIGIYLIRVRDCFN